MKKLLLIGNCFDYANDSYTLEKIKEDKDNIIKTAKEELEFVKYINIRVGTDNRSILILTYLIQLLQNELNNCPLFLDSDSQEVIKAGLKIYNRSKAKPFISSANFGEREDYIQIAADFDTKVVCDCMRDEVPMNEQERLDYCSYILEKGMLLNIQVDDMYFDPVTVSVVESQDQLPEVIDTIKQISDLKLNTICQTQKVSGWVQGKTKPFIESAFINIAMAKGLKAAIVNPKMKLLMANIKAGENILDTRLFSQSEWNSIIEDLRSLN